MANIRRKDFCDQSVNFLIAAIPVIGFVLFGLIPMVISLLVSFTSVKQSFITENIVFIGFKNYGRLFQDRLFWKSFGNTLLYTLNVPFSLGFGLIVAYLVNSSSKGQKFFRFVFFIPYVCSTAAIALSWKIMYNYEYGIFNAVLNDLGLKAVGWITSPNVFMFSTMLMTIWASSGICIILYQAALANVNPSYLEAAQIDGAREITVFFRIVVPAISPTTFYLLTMKLIGSLQVMAETQMLSGDSASLNWADSTVVNYLYRMGFIDPIYYGQSIASAAGWILSIIIILITWLNFRLGKKYVNYDIT